MTDQPKKRKAQQVLTFAILFTGYTLYMLDRKSFAINIPNIKQAENVDSESIGSVISSLAVGYAIGKFVSGILVDTWSPSYLLSFGLVMCGSINLAFSITTSKATYAALWFSNGVFQGLGWPSCGKLLRNWYSPAIFGTLWSILSSSMNVAASISPFVCNALFDSYGSWRYSLRFFGVLSYLVAVISFLLIHDTPESYGLEEDEKTSKASEQKKKTGKKKSRTTFTGAICRIMRSPFIYVMSFAFFCSLLLKGVMSDWGPLYLITEKNATRTMASTFTGSVEMGGLTGAILSGMITDWIASHAPKEQQKGHPRNAYLIPCIAILVGSLAWLRMSITSMPHQYFQTLTVGYLIGYSLYGLIGIIGVMTMESSAKDLSGTSHAVASLFGNVGLTMSGFPFTVVVESYSWSTSFFIIECCLIMWAILAIFSQFIVCRIGDLKEKEE